MDHSGESPGSFIRAELEARGWSQTDLARIADRPIQVINEVVLGKRAVSPETAAALGAAFGDKPEVWLQREAAFRLRVANVDTDGIEHRARLFELAPIKDMEKRGWIAPTASTDALERELRRFFGQADLSCDPDVGASLRSSIKAPINSAQRAWCFRAKQLARAIKVSPYTDRGLEKGVKQLRRLAAWPESARKISEVLAAAGVRFVVVEPLPKTRIDGAALWLDEQSPVIALSLRFDRIDSVWHTLGHELSHIRHRDGAAVDIDLFGEDRPAASEQSDVEKRADEEAAATWVDPADLQSFIVRVGPLYSRERVNQFANRMKMHPGIIVGQLQHRGELGYHALRDNLAKVRDLITAEALTDGWGHSVSLKSGGFASHE